MSATLAGRLLVLTAVLALMPERAGAEDTAYSAARRAEYVGSLVEAIGSMEPEAREALAEELYLGARRECRSGYGPPPAGCLLELARQVCGERSERLRPACHRVADVVITNLASEWELVDESTRVSLMNRSESFRAAMREELRARYALLAAELSLSRRPGADADPGAAIDRFCVGYTRARGLTWSRCVAALAWYMSTSAGASEER